tara:strand:+ start:174 stop:983 length:810 start_codon:yes stop_codon:yes gene_type:complete
MSTVYDRLAFNFDSTKFGSGNEFTDGQKVALSSQISIKQWQIDDMANSTVSGYFENPHTDNLVTLTTLSSNFVYQSNTSLISYTFASAQANTLNATANTLLLEIPNFKDHTDRMSGVSSSNNKLIIPDYNIAMQVGRQILTITNQTDNIQNNSPILGNFTSLVIGSDIANSIVILTNNLSTLNNSISLVGGNLVSNIDSSTMNTIITNVQTTYNLLYNRRTGDTTFYTNSISLLQDYQTVSQFNALGATSSYLIENYIGTTKLKTNLAS